MRNEENLKSENTLDRHRMCRRLQSWAQISFTRIFEPNIITKQKLFYRVTKKNFKMSRRRIPPTSRPTPPSFQPASSPLNNEFNEPIIPKHIAFIQSNFMQGDNEILCEFIMFMFTIIAASSQFVHLYRSVWWYQESYTNYSMVSLKLPGWFGGDWREVKK